MVITYTHKGVLKKYKKSLPELVRMLKIQAGIEAQLSREEIVKIHAEKFKIPYRGNDIDYIKYVIKTGLKTGKLPKPQLIR